MTALSLGYPSTPILSHSDRRKWSLLIYLLLVNIFLLHKGWLLETDLLWHIRSGTDIIANMAFPEVDHYSYSQWGRPWMAKEWLSQLILSLLYKLFDWRGVAFACAAITAGALAFFFYAFSRYCQAIYLVALIFMIFPAITLVARPQILIFPLFVVVLYVLEKAIAQKTPMPWWILIVTAIWTNLHASAPIIVVLIFFYAIESLWNVPREHVIRLGLKWFVFGLLNLIVLGFTPYGFDPLIFALTFPGQGIADEIMEWRSIYASTVDFEYSQYVGYIVFPAILLFSGLILSASEKRFWPISIRLVFFAFAGLMHIRFVQIFDFVAAAAIARMLGQAAYASKLKSFSFINMSTWAKRLALVMLCISASIATIYGLDNVPVKKYFPTNAYQATKGVMDRGHVFNSYDYGGFLIFYNVPTLVDGRAELYLNTILKSYKNAIESPDVASMENFIKSHDIQWAFVISGSLEDSKFSQMKNWRCIYADADASVYESFM